MAKLFFILAVLALSFFAANASIRASITLEEEPENQRGTGGQGGCREQIRRVQNLQNCQRYLDQQSRYYDDVNQRQELEQCCNELRQLDSQCRCEGLRQAVRQQTGGRGQGSQQAYSQAGNIPSLCRMQPSRCDIRSMEVVEA